jgi:hypothetical protein
MAAFTSPSRGHYWLWAAIFLGSTGLVIGCNPQTLNFLLMPFVDDKEQPKCKLASPDKKEVMVAIVTTFASMETRPEMLPIESELSDRLAAEMRKRAAANKEKIKFIPTAKVRSLMNQAAGNTLSSQEIGRKLKADFVINLEINSISLYEKGSFNQLFRGKTEIELTCVDVNKPSGEATPFKDIYVREYPGARGPVDAGNSSVLEFRTKFLDVLAQDLARYFIAYSPDENRRMD